MQEFDFMMDVCASDKNHKVDCYFTKEYSGLDKFWSWHDQEPQTRCWMNPPYGRKVVQWVQKAYDEKQNGVTTVCLLPARTDTRWWGIFYDHVNWRTWDPRDEIRLLKGRIKFVGAPASAPFPSAVVVLRGT